ncbi:MAG TPA: AroM family protein [Nitrolancea sp.]|nr:AroM family protein [Nitrolancea sp.]
MQRVGLITIGQSPREDIVASMFDQSAALRFIEHGALDELSPAQIEQLVPDAQELPLVSRLRNGTEVVLAKERLIPHLQRAVDQVAHDGAALAVILCTGEFAKIAPPIPAIYPDRVLAHTIEAILPVGTVGVMLPHEGQMRMMEHKWATATRRFIGVAVSPYSGQAELGEQARSLREAGADMIVLDCMGFDGAMKQLVAAETGLPTILANRLVGRVVEELVGA